MRRSSCAVLLALLLAGCGAEPPERGAIATVTSAVRPAAVAASDAVPVLLPDQSYGIERSDPPAVVARKTRRMQQVMRLLREAATAPRDAAGGCVRDRPTLDTDTGTPPLAWMVRRPEVLRVVVLGRQVQVDVRLPQRAPSVACRVMDVTTNITSGRGAAFRNQVHRHVLLGREGLAGRTVRFVSELPSDSRPPYELTVNTEDIVGGRSAYEAFTLRCPAGGCLPPRDLSRPLATKGRFAPTGVTTASLERSLEQVLAGEPSWVRAESVRCTSTTRCDVALRDPVAQARVRTTFAILGERRRGCWMAMVERSAVTPHAAAVVPSTSVFGPLGGCVDWAG